MKVPWNTLVRLSVCSFVSLSVCLEFSFGATSRNFLLFCAKLGCHLNLKSHRVRFFEKKKSCSRVFGSKRYKMGLKWHISSFMKNQRVGFDLSLDQSWPRSFFEGKSCVGISGLKLAKLGPKWRYSQNFYNS